MIKSVTKEQAALGRKIRDEWIQRGLSTQPVDRAAAEDGFRLAYRKAEIERDPQVRWFSSPLKGITAAVFLILDNQPTISDAIFRNVLRAADADLNEKIDWQVKQVLERELTGTIAEYTGTIASAVATELDIRGSVIGDARPRVGKIIEKLVNCAVVGTQESFALYDYADRILGIKGASKTRGLLAVNAGWYWPFEKTVIATERPSKILLDDDGKPHCDDGPAIAYADGFSIYCRHGVRVPPEAISRDKGEVKWDDIQVTVDKSVQGALTEIKAEEWSEQKAGDETEEERYEAAMAVKRLAGVGGVRDLVEEEN